MRGVLRFLVPSEELDGIRVLEDEEGAVALAENLASRSNSKHVNVRSQLLR